MMLEKSEECPRCSEVRRWLYDAQICAACGYGNVTPTTKSGSRALDAVASHICCTRLTDGFCRPDTSPRKTPDCDCVVEARGVLQALRSRGMKPVWVFEKDSSND